MIRDTNPVTAKPGQRRTDGKPEDNDLDVATRRRRLVYRCNHSGTKELDALLGGFAAAHVAAFDSAALDEFEAILACPSPDIYTWLIKREAVPSRLEGPVMKMMLNFNLGQQ